LISARTTLLFWMIFVYNSSQVGDFYRYMHAVYVESHSLVNNQQSEAPPKLTKFNIFNQIYIIINETCSL
jgi:hypothetical protein